MHHHAEIVIPPTDTDRIKDAVSQIMKPFSENNEKAKHTFCDWWEIGGRWSGHKLLARCGEDELNSFYDWLQSEKITVSNVIWGKRTLMPSQQATKINSEWQRRFPWAGKVCPIFDNFESNITTDIITVECLPSNLSCSTLIIAGFEYESSGLCAKELYLDSVWNGVTWQKTVFERNVPKAIESYNTDLLKNCKKSYADTYIVRSNWLVVTVDYHS